MNNPFVFDSLLNLVPNKRKHCQGDLWFHNVIELFQKKRIGYGLIKRLVKQNSNMKIPFTDLLTMSAVPS